MGVTQRGGTLSALLPHSLSGNVLFYYSPLNGESLDSGRETVDQLLQALRAAEKRQVGPSRERSGSAAMACSTAKSLSLVERRSYSRH